MSTEKATEVPLLEGINREVAALRSANQRQTPKTRITVLVLALLLLGCDDDAAVHHRLTVYDASGKVLLSREGGYCGVFGERASRGELYVVGGKWEVARPENGYLVCEPIP